MALSPHQTGRTDDRRETWHRRIARRAVLKRITVQADLPRSLGHPASDVVVEALVLKRLSYSSVLENKHRYNIPKNSRAVPERSWVLSFAESSFIDSMSCP